MCHAKCVGHTQSQKKLIKGIHALAKFLRVSQAKAQSLKNSGIIPYSQSGRIVPFDQHEVLAALNSPVKNKWGLTKLSVYCLTIFITIKDVKMKKEVKKESVVSMGEDAAIIKEAG